MDFTIVTAVTKSYLDKLKWALPTWWYKPQFRDKPIVVFHNYEDTDPKCLRFIKDIFPNWTFVKWTMEEYDNERELMLSAFVLGIKEYVKTPYFVKLDADTYFTDNVDVFDKKDFKYGLVGHKWGYTKPGWWIDFLDSKPMNKNEKIHKHNRIASFCCLHKTDFVVKAAEGYKRLPVPSHDTYMWWYADKFGTWRPKNMKKFGVNNRVRWRAIREETCASPAHDNPIFNKVLTDKVQLEITTDCNLKCHNCDRNCGTAPSKEYMPIEQIWKFVEESLELKKKWTRIDILGGEPTLYPDLDMLWKVIKIYKNKYPRCRIRFSTNGIKPVDIPEWVDVRNSIKGTRKQKHTAYNCSPYDAGEKKIVCCSVPWRCGLGLTKYGYFLCGSGASLARVAGLDIGIKNLRDVNYKVMLKQIKKLCKHCGHSHVQSKHYTDKQETSPTWERAFKKYERVVMSEY